MSCKHIENLLVIDNLLSHIENLTTLNNNGKNGIYYSGHITNAYCRNVVNTYEEYSEIWALSIDRGAAWRDGNKELKSTVND